MTSVGPVQQVTRALPSAALGLCGVPARSATADFAALMRVVGQGSPPACSTGSVGQAEWLAQACRQPDIEAALAQFHMARRLLSSPASRTARCPSGTSANLPKSRDCNAAEGLSNEGAEAIACAPVHETERSDGRHQDPPAQADDPCARDAADGVAVHWVSAVAAPLAMWPLAWGGWPSYPSFQLASQAPRVRVSRKRRWYPSAIAPEDESGDCGQPLGEGRCHPPVAANRSPGIADGGTLGVFSY